MPVTLATPVVVSRVLQAGAGALASPCLTILMFHRVLQEADPLFPAEMHAQRFDRLMGIVARTHRIMRLKDAVSRLKRGDLPRRALTITFDDGYADNAQVALPILKRHGLAATFFVSTGFLDGGLMWNDAVIECIRGTALESIDLESIGLSRVETSTLPTRRAAISLLLPRLKHLHPRDRSASVARLHHLAGSPSLPAELMMRSDQVQELFDAGMEIGAHTVHHPILKSITLDDAELEIRDGRDRLQEIINSRVETLAYPNGRPGLDYEASHVDLVERLGFAAAVSTARGVSRCGDDVFQLPRFTPWDQSDLRWIARLALMPSGRSFSKL